MTAYSEADIVDQLGSHVDWKYENSALVKQFELAGFMDVVRLVNDVAGPAEAADHHPDMFINYRRITFTLTTHDAGGVTEKDFALLEEIEKSVANASS
jgi:4a-hydroxytetrahydrobiopterin dehydratase